MFSHLIGNSLAKALLTKMLHAKQVPSSLLFYGPCGVGKSLFAKSFLSALQGPNHPDLYQYYPDGKLCLHSVDTIRELISEVQKPPYSASIKGFIIHDAERMWPYSSNALLKTLEEPLITSKIILLTSDPTALLPTIVSRCAKIPFMPICEEQLVTFLVREKNIDPIRAKRLSFLAQGSLSQVERLMQEDPLRPSLLQLLKNPLQSSHILAIEEELMKERETPWLQELDLFLEKIYCYFRDRHLLSVRGNPALLYFSQEELSFFNAPLPSLEKVANLLHEVRLAASRGVSLRASLEHLFLQLT